MSVLSGMWYGSLYAYHGLQRMSRLPFLSFLTPPSLSSTVMSVLSGMWYGSLYAYHGLQRMSVLTFLSFLTAPLYDLAVTGPLTVTSDGGAELAAMKTI